MGAVPLPRPLPWTLHFDPGWGLEDPPDPALLPLWELAVPVRGGLSGDIPVGALTHSQTPAPPTDSGAVGCWQGSGWGPPPMPEGLGSSPAAK